MEIKQLKKELKLGRYFSYYNETCVGMIYGLQINDFSNSCKIAISIEGGGYTVIEDLNDIKPIRPTEDWLIKLGMEKKGSYWHPKGSWHRYLFHPKRPFGAALNLEPKGGIVPHAKSYYVHQIQDVLESLNQKP